MTEVASQSTRSRPFRYSVGNLLLVVTVVSLATALLLTHRKLSQIERKLAETERELTTFQPLRADEVARQFVERTTINSISTTVQDVRYSPTDDAYKVKFSWVDPTTGKKWSSEVKLAADGYGTYMGRITFNEFFKSVYTPPDKPFVEPLSGRYDFVVVVQTPSPIKR